MHDTNQELERRARLNAAYDEIGQRTWSASDFAPANLAVSRDLFTPESLSACTPVPKELEVFALLSGLAFDTGFIERLVDVQNRITEILDGRLHYWVRPQNLGVEYCVFKWPTDAWSPNWLSPIKSALSEVRRAPYRFEIGGIQINADGCVIAKGFDEDSALFQIRARIRDELAFVPKKQSNWAHVPLGRILEPIGTERFEQLRRLIADLTNRTIVATTIDNMKLVHETRWYMEERTVVDQYSFSDHQSCA